LTLLTTLTPCNSSAQLEAQSRPMYPAHAGKKFWAATVTPMARCLRDTQTTPRNPNNIDLVEFSRNGSSEWASPLPARISQVTYPSRHPFCLTRILLHPRSHSATLSQTTSFWLIMYRLKVESKVDRFFHLASEGSGRCQSTHVDVWCKTRARLTPLEM
jgi:hypothetical protein